MPASDAQSTVAPIHFVVAAAVTDIIDSHHYTTTADATVGVTLNATMDIGCDGFIPPALNQALTDGAVTMDAVDASLTNLFRVR